MKKFLCTLSMSLVALVSVSGCSTQGGQPVTSDNNNANVKEDVEEVDLKPEEGTRENPYPAGSSAKWDTSSIWTFSVGDTNFDSSEFLESSAGFLMPPQREGDVYVTAPAAISISDDASEPFDPAFSVEITFVSEQGNSFDTWLCSTPLPEGAMFSQTGDMFPGASSEFIICAEVPKEATSNGTWRFSYTGSGDDVFFNASSKP